MKKSATIWAVVIVVLILGVWYWHSTTQGPAMNQMTPQVATPDTTSTQPMPTTSTPVTTPVSATPATSTVSVSIQGFAFNPQTLTIKAGTKVTWTNNDTVSHTVTSDSGNLLNSPSIAPGQSFSFTFTDAGTVNYHCAIHPMMTGSIVVI